MKPIQALWRTARWLGVTSLLSIMLGPSTSGPAQASDHLDAPLTQADAIADLGDFYAWYTDRGTIVAIVTFNPGIGPIDPSAPPEPYDAEVLYTIHIDNTADPAENADFIDNDNDNQPDLDIEVRFGQNGAGDWGVQLLGVPGSSGPMVGRVQTSLTSGSAQAMAGVFDDPFFFDLDAYDTTISQLLDDMDPVDLVFDSGTSTDTFASSNALAIAVEFDAATALGGNVDGYLQLWATSGRLP